MTLIFCNHFANAHYREYSRFLEDENIPCDIIKGMNLPYELQSRRVKEFFGASATKEFEGNWTLCDTGDL